jgi:trehalose synthase
MPMQHTTIRAGFLGLVAALLTVGAAAGELGAGQEAATRPPSTIALAQAQVRADEPNSSSTDAAYIRWLEDQSMLRQSERLATQFSGNKAQWQHPYALPQPRAASTRASVWFTAYPASTISPPGASVLKTLADARLWQAFEKIGIQGLHTGPMKRAGGITGRELTPTVDGSFDRISFDIDPAFGSNEDYLSLVATAKSHQAIVIGDVIPGHTGKGADFRLAERAYRDYPGLYHMVAIDPQDWNLLPPVPAGRDSANLSAATVDQLAEKGYIVGQLQRTFFYARGIKDTDWSATAVVRGVDGVERRWVYLHYFKEGQPTLNWLDPSFAAPRLVVGDALHEISVLGDGMIRLDANGFLGIERKPQSLRAWSEGHPLSITANAFIGGMVRKLGAFTFQELNLTLEDLREMSRSGADLSYDFVTRPAYQHALVTGDTEFLRLMLKLMRQYEIDPASLIHAMQNHDELTLELNHFIAHQDDSFAWHGASVTGGQLRTTVQNEMFERVIGERAPYNLKAGDGVACTTASLIAATLGYRDPGKLTQADRQKIAQAHLLLAYYNALQPGVFALSGWDLVGAFALPSAVVKDRMADGDARWVNRGAYDLLGANASAKQSVAGLPKAIALYGPLPEQLKQADSFASQLARMLQVRKELKLFAARQLAVPEVKAKGLLAMVHELPDGGGIEVTALNFGHEAIDEVITVPQLKAGANAVDVLNAKATAVAVSADGGLRLQLKPYEGKALVIKP